MLDVDVKLSVYARSTNKLENSKWYIAMSAYEHKSFSSNLMSVSLVTKHRWISIQLIHKTHKYAVAIEKISFWNRLIKQKKRIQSNIQSKY